MFKLNESNNNWIDRFQYRDCSIFQKYVASFYWVTYTVVTVGYGDIYAQNTVERIISCLLMFGGVVFYSFVIGSLTSLLSDLDAKIIIFQQKLNILYSLKRKYELVY
jgi:Ion channel